MKCTTVCLAVLALLGLQCDAQGKPRDQTTNTAQKPSSYQQRPSNPQQRPSQTQKPGDPQKPSYDQFKQTFEVFTWTYPPQDEEPTSPLVDVELKEPVPAETVIATCSETYAEVTVLKDLFNNGQIIYANDLTLGGCSHFGEDATSLVFQPELHRCESISEVSTVQK